MTYAALRALGLASWAGCIICLLYQAATWVFTANWPRLSLMDLASSMFQVDVSDIASTLPFQAAIKTTYMLLTTELSIGLWFIGTFFLLSAFLANILLKK